MITTCHYEPNEERGHIIRTQYGNGLIAATSGVKALGVLWKTYVVAPGKELATTPVVDRRERYSLFIFFYLTLLSPAWKL